VTDNLHGDTPLQKSKGS